MLPIVDLFAGPGGLGEGFSQFNDGRTFHITVSAEMNSAAHSTLRLRAYYRLLKAMNENKLDVYYKYCNGEADLPYDDSTKEIWGRAGLEARQLTLGLDKDNQTLETILNDKGICPTKPWVLIGGPPCQAYSLVGRSRNAGIKDYRPETDARHFLYKEYLKIIQKYKPAIFVMENVKGILSSKINGKKIFHSILLDLAEPDKAFGLPSNSGYKIYSLSSKTVFKRGMDPESINLHDYIVRAEKFGVPQARHRVILLGIREDIPRIPVQLEECNQTTVNNAIGNMPPLRSSLSKTEDTDQNWAEAVRRQVNELKLAAEGNPKYEKLVEYLDSVANTINFSATKGGLRVPRTKTANAEHYLQDWYRDTNLDYHLNHESRGHMESDLKRYIFASSYAAVYGHSPKGHLEFDLDGLRPNHKNWESGKFSDRFRVQLQSNPATTVTSHISKDGHYFIHPDPKQCRSLTVREAARLQTFPDNYFFQGNRTEQFHQVGNAVPPLLAFKIASLVDNVLNDHEQL